MKRIVATILIIIGAVTIVTPDNDTSLSAFSGPTIVGSQVDEQASYASSSISYNNDDNTGCDSQTHMQHQCHFGHCFFIVSVNSISVYGEKYKASPVMKSLVLTSFISSLLRPPIV